MKGAKYNLSKPKKFMIPLSGSDNDKEQQCMAAK